MVRGINDNRVFKSAFFVLDITDPVTPKLLGEMTMNSDPTITDLNYTTSSPTMVVMKDNDNIKTKWNLIMGSGPTDLDGSNSGEKGRLAVLPLVIVVLVL